MGAFYSPYFLELHKNRVGGIAFAIFDETQDNDNMSTTTANTKRSNRNSSSNSNTKPEKLTPAEKAKIKGMYESLEESKMWEARPGLLVEREIAKFGMECDFEHPCHSMIIDTRDKRWETVFDADDLALLKQQDMKRLPGLPADVSSTINAFKGHKSLRDLYQHIQSTDVFPQDDPNGDWVRSTVRECLKLLLFQFFPLNEQSEYEILYRVWGCISSAFDPSDVKCRGYARHRRGSFHNPWIKRFASRGEQVSTASAISRNQDRVIAAVDDIERYLSGRKVDLIMMKDRNEYGCAEASKLLNDTETKVLMDSGFKTPKVLKDMLNEMAKQAPALLGELTVPGFVLTDKT